MAATLNQDLWFTLTKMKLVRYALGMQTIDPIKVSEAVNHQITAAKIFLLSNE
jgi:hypothetical protein